MLNLAWNFYINSYFSLLFLCILAHQFLTFSARVKKFSWTRSFLLLTFSARVNGPNQAEERKRFLNHLSNLRIDMFKRGRINIPSDRHLLVFDLIDLTWFQEISPNFHVQFPLAFELRRESHLKKTSSRSHQVFIIKIF